MGHVLRSSGYKLSGLEIVRAEGCRLFTTEGRELVDFEGGVWATALGHNHPRIRRVIEDQQQGISHIGYRVIHAAQEDAAVEVLRTVGLEDGACLFLASGSEAVEFGVQLARRVSDRPLLLTLAESFLASYGSAGTKPESEWFLFDRIQCADCAGDRDCASDCPQLSRIPFDRIGAFVFEPGSSGGFVRFPQEKLIRTLANKVRESGGLLVVNEVTTGMGRTGAWFAYQHVGLRPDIVVIGKGLGNGYPVSAVALHSSVLAAIEGSDFHYAQSHQNDPLGCAVAAEVIRTLRDEQLVARSADVGTWFQDELLALAAQNDRIREVRGRGLMLAIEFAPDKDSFALRDVYDNLLDRGFLVGYKPAGQLFRFLPPLTIGKAEISAMIAALDDALSQGPN